MGKKKLCVKPGKLKNTVKKQKDPVATKVATGIRKSKTKVVATNLKRINFQCRSKTDALNAEFKDLTTNKIQQKSEASAEQEQKKHQAQSEMTKAQNLHENKEVDIDMAIEEISKLSSL